MVLSSIEYRSI